MAAGDTVAATRHWKRVLEIEPKNPDAKRFLGVSE
jgi:hypothetical protein